MAKQQQRWFVLYRTGEIHYFEKQWLPAEGMVDVASKGHKGVISLAGVKSTDVARSKPTSTTDFSFAIVTPKRKWVLTAASQNQFDEWYTAIGSMLDGASGGHVMSGRL